MHCILHIPLLLYTILARSANLPEGMYILLALISFFFFFFTMSKVISVSTGLIFTIFSPNGRYLREFSWSGPVFPIPQGTLQWQPILCRKQNANHVRFLQNWSNGCWDITLTVFTARGYAKRGICRRRVSVCLSVTLRYCIKTAKLRLSLIHISEPTRPY